MLVKILIGCLMMAGCMQTTLYQHWIHSHEEDDATNKYIVYRPATFSFPPARGRSGFEIKEKGVFVDRPIAAGDGNNMVERRWILKDGELIVTSSEKQIYRFKIISLSKDKLVVKKIN